MLHINMYKDTPAYMNNIPDILGKKSEHLFWILLERRQWKRQCTSLLALHFASYIQHTRSVFRKKPMKAVWQ